MTAIKSPDPKPITANRKALRGFDRLCIPPEVNIRQTDGKCTS